MKLARLLILLAASLAVIVLTGCAEPKIDISKSGKPGGALTHPKVPTAPPAGPTGQSADQKKGS